MDIFIPRWLPLLLASTGVWASASAGVPGVRDLVDIAKIGATKYELASLAHHIHLDSACGFALPDPARPESLGPYIRKVAFTYAGRDPSVDFWGQPYTFGTHGGPETWELRSSGPNAKGDLCMADLAPASGEGASDDTLVALPDGSTAEPGPSALGDDICVIVKPQEY